jgi:hypothetical protein
VPIIINDGLGEIKLEKITADTWRLIEPYTYNSDTGRQIHIPSGFVTDGASSPIFLIQRIGGHYTTAAIVHDFLYTTAALPRVEADAILFEIMSKTGVNFWVKWGIWFIVRGFGGPLLRKIGVRQ